MYRGRFRSIGLWSNGTSLGVRCVSGIVLDQLYAQHPWVAYLAPGAIIVASGEAGYLVGKSWRNGPSKAAGSDLSTLEAAMLGLLALLIGFTFSIALNRFDARLAGVIEEANAIGTTMLRARMLPPTEASEVQRLLRDYVQLRIKLGGAPSDPALFETTIRSSNEIQQQLWAHAVAVSAADPHSISTGLFVQTLNEMIDLQEVRLAAARNRVPPAVFLMLDAVAMVTLAFTGYVGGLYRQQGPLPVAIMGFLAALVIGIVGDFDASQAGFITTSQQAMLDLERSLDP